MKNINEFLNFGVQENEEIYEIYHVEKELTSIYIDKTRIFWIVYEGFEK